MTLEAVSGLAVSEARSRRVFAQKIFLLYCSISYFVPYLLVMLIGNPLDQHLRPMPNYHAGLLYAIGCVILFWWILKIPPIRFDSARRIFGEIGRTIFSVTAALFMATVFLLLSAWSAMRLGISFRHSGEQLSDVGALGYLLLIFKAYAGVATLVNYRLVKERVQTAARSAVLCLIFLGYLINIQGSFDVIFASFSLVAATYPLRRRVGLSGSAAGNLGLVAFPLLVAAMFAAGIINKMGMEGFKFVISNPSEISRIFVGRMSYDLYSLGAHISENFFNAGMWVQAVRDALHTFIYRFGLLIGETLPRPEVGSVARANFLFLTYEYRDRIGATPGMLGSAFYLPGGGLSVLYYLFFVRFCVFQAWNIAGRKLQSWLALLFIMTLLSGVFDSAVDILNPVGLSFSIFVFLYLGGNYMISRMPVEAAQPFVRSRTSAVASAVGQPRHAHIRGSGQPSRG